MGLSRRDESRLSGVDQGYGPLRGWANRDIKANENRTLLDRFAIYSYAKSRKVGHLFPWDAAAEPEFD